MILHCLDSGSVCFHMFFYHDSQCRGSTYLTNQRLVEATHLVLEMILSLIRVFPKIVGKPQKWMVYNGKPYLNGWFGGTIIFGNTHTLAVFRTLSVLVNIYIWAKIITTSAEVSPKCGLVRESSQNALESDLGTIIIVICPDIYIYNIHV